MTDVLSEEELAGIEARANAATQGPWGIESCGEKGDGSNMIGVLFDTDVDTDCERPILGWAPECRPMTGDFIEYYRDELVAECEHRNRNSGRDAEFIAHARTDIPRLLAHIRATSSRPSGAEAMREAAAKVADNALRYERATAFQYKAQGREDQEALFNSGATVATNIAKAIRALPIAPQEVSEGDLLAELAKHPQWELSATEAHFREGELSWYVHSVTGGPNDRVWEQLSEAETPRAALQAALSVKEKKNG